MAALTRQLVNEYIRDARSSAQSEPDLSVIRLAALINTNPVEAQRELNRELGLKGLYLTSLKFAAEDEKRSVKRRGGTPVPVRKPTKLNAEALNVQKLILDEIHMALCTKEKYRKQIADLKRYANKLVILMAGYLAGKAAIAESVLLALVAATLRFALRMGVSVFCKWYASGRET